MTLDSNPAHPQSGGLMFDTEAELYERARPGYPPALLELLRTHCNLVDGSDVLEIGAGPGQATALLVDAGARVTAVEPGVNFAARLVSRFPGVDVVVDRFEDAVVATAAFDLALSGTAFHWVDHQIGLPKIHDALRPGGWMALVWNRFSNPDDPVEFTSATQPIMDHHVPDYHGSLGPGPDPAPWRERIVDAGFVDHEEIGLPWKRTETTQQVVDRFLTHSGPLLLDDQGRTALAADLRHLCDERFGGVVAQSYLTVVHLARRPN